MSIDDFKNGWLVGDFTPALVNTKDVEVGLLHLPSGHRADNHYHRLHTEWNLLVSGLAMTKDRYIYPGEIFVYKPGERADVCYPNDSVVLVIKSPSTKNDKHY